MGQGKAKGRTLLSLGDSMETGLVSLLLPTPEHFRSRLGNQQSSPDGVELKRGVGGSYPFPSPGLAQMQSSKEKSN